MPFGTRDICSKSQNRWMNGDVDTRAIGMEHPNAKGYQYYAKLYLDSLTAISRSLPTRRPYPAAGPEPSPANPAPAIRRRSPPDPGQAGLYVALGDSYSSGRRRRDDPRAGRRGHSEPCCVLRTIHGVVRRDVAQPVCRATNNASRQVAAAKGYTLNDFACGGATTDTILTKSQTAEGPQINRVTAATKLVTLTIGGNDAGLLNVITCVRQSDCGRNNATMKQLNANVTRPIPKIANTLAEIKQGAPNAQIRIAGYPYLLPVPGAPLNATCAAQMTQAELQAAKDLQDRFNT